MKKNNNLDDYVKENNVDILIYSFLLIIVTVILLLVGYKTHCYFILLLDIFFLNLVISRIEVKYNLIKIKKYLFNHNLINEVGTIEYWNEKNYFLTESYMIILKNGKVNCFKYSDIVSIKRETNVLLKEYSEVNEYLIITLSNNEKYKILSYSTTLTNEKYKDISNFLLEKNNKIVENNNNNMRF